MKTEVARIHVFKMMDTECLYVQRTRANGTLQNTNSYHPAPHLLARMIDLCQQAHDNGTARISLSPDGWQVFSRAYLDIAYKLPQ